MGEQIGKTARQIMRSITTYLYIDRENNQKCTIEAGDKGVLQVLYEDGHWAEYNDLVGPDRLSVIGMKCESSRLEQSVQSQPKYRETTPSNTIPDAFPDDACPFLE